MSLPVSVIILVAVLLALALTIVGIKLASKVVKTVSLIIFGLVVAFVIVLGQALSRM